jgi:hypothetical protein
MYFLSGSYLLNPWDEFHKNLVKCSHNQDDMQNLCFNLAGPRSRSPVVFEDLNNIYCPFICANFVWSITTQPHKGTSWNFSQMFSLSRRRAETHVQTWPAQGQGHQWCLKIDLNHAFRVRFISF